jgi:high-affinity nickel permease
MTLLPALTFGFALGVRHATDADHIAAVGTFAAHGQSTQRAMTLGMAWGIGHSASVLLVGGALVLLRLPMPVRIALALEFCVALMLIALGALALVRRGERGVVSARRPLLIGVVHGLAGSAVLALLVVGATADAMTAAAYLVCFCVGTIAGMGLVTGLMTLPSRLGASHALRIDRFARVAAGVASVAIGLALAHRVGVRDGLFAATPTLPQ